MVKILFLPVVFALTAINLCGAADMNLDQALSHALRESDDIKIIRQRQEAGMQSVRNLKSAAFPKIDFSASSIYQSSPTERTFGLLGGAQSGGTPAGMPQFDNRFDGFVHSWRTSLYQPVYTFGRLGVLYKMAREQEEILELRETLEIDLFLLQVVKNHTDAMLYQQQINASEKAEELMKEVMETTKRDLDAGMRPRVELLRVQARHAQAQARSERFRLLHQTAISQLKILMGWGSDEPVQPSFLPVDSLDFAKGIDTKPSSEALELKMKKQELALNQKRVKYERANFFPSIGLSGSMGSQYSDYGDIEIGAPEDLIKPNLFDYSVGLQLNWNVFNGFATSATVREQQALARVAEREQSKLEKELQIRQNETTKQLQIAKNLAEASEKEVRASRLAFEQTQLDFKAGNLPLTELLRMEADWREALSLQFEAEARVILAMAEYKMVHGMPLIDGVQK